MRRYQVHGVVLIITVAAALSRHVALSLPGTCSATDKEATASCPSTSSAGNCGFPAIFNFGSSNSDTGGLAAAFGEYHPPYGQTFFHHPAGRASDGRLLLDFIAESLGLPYLSAYLDSMGSNFTHGANFATGGSTIKPQNTSRAQSGFSPISLDVQFIQFSQFQTRSQQIRNQGGVFAQLFPDEKAFSSALYNFDIGHNDLTAAYGHRLTSDQMKASFPDLILQLSNTIKNVYAKGGRTFWIHNIDPLGCLPSIMNSFLVPGAQTDEAGCLKLKNEITQSYNIKLKEMVDELRKLLPLASITYLDMYSVKHSLISNAKKLGFDDPFLVCCGNSGRYNFNPSERCGNEVNGKVTSTSCENPQSRINWDGLHYTEAANKWIIDQIVNGSFSDPPVPLNLSCKH